MPPVKSALSPGTVSAPSSDQLPPWDLYTVFVCLLSGYILVPLLLSNILLLIDPFMGPVRKVILEQGVTVLTWLIIFGGLHWRYGHLPHYLGLSMTRPRQYYQWETVLLILLSGGLTLLLSLLWAALTQWWPGLNLGTDPFADFSRSQIWAMSLFAVFTAPILEELIFRGLVQSTLHQRWGRIGSVFYGSLIFMLFHGSYLNNAKALTHVIVIGLCFAIWRERTRSLIPGMVAHWFNNLLATVLMLSGSG
ncbi:CPBP family intramembrane glutamic endopeptidase [Vampirovibrio chlorellavorus]|uniref:CPBP family intramembrane glutamic endopeptidase n=1 Tax=Vampirovibrio chlorellavorus TaxID=758823 RepID=UPI0026EC453A|nr:CPBP family intramembrane glutamic endopeptidase [Vampirovibrio chlorellavorus]